jgi:hypothetical protein
MPMMDRSAAKLQLAWMRGQYMLRMLDLTAHLQDRPPGQSQLLYYLLRCMR